MHCVKSVYREDKVRVLVRAFVVTLGNRRIFVSANEEGLIEYRNLINVRILNLLTQRYTL